MQRAGRYPSPRVNQSWTSWRKARSLRDLMWGLRDSFRWLRKGGWAFVFSGLFCSGVSHAQDRLPNEPMVLKPGEWKVFKGAESKILEQAKFWTSFSLDTEVKDGQTRLRADKAAPLGIHFLRAFAGDKITPWQPVLLDDLPLLSRGERKNGSAERALDINGAAILTGTIKSRDSEYYRIKLGRGESITIEVLAQRILSSLDPYLRLLDERGRQLAFCDDEPGLGTDSRLRYTAKSAESIIIEVRDTAYQGSDKHVYALRVGDFPKVNAAFIGNDMQLLWLGPEAEDVKATSAEGHSGVARWYAPRRAASKPAALVVLPIETAEVSMEKEPNDTQTTAITMSVQGCVYGRFEKADDVDWFAWEAKKGEKFVVRVQTRSLGLPTDVRLSAHSPDGISLATSKPTAEDEGGLSVTSNGDGKVFLRVSHIAGLGGPEQGYRLSIEPAKAAFIASTETDDLVIAPDGTADLKLTLERAGYDGAITYELEPKITGLSLSKAGVEAKKKEGTLQFKADASMAPGSIYQVRVQAVNPAGGQVQTYQTFTNKLGTSATMAAVLDGWITVAIKEKPAPKGKPKTP